MLVSSEQGFALSSGIAEPAVMKTLFNKACNGWDAGEID